MTLCMFCGKEKPYGPAPCPHCKQHGHQLTPRELKLIDLVSQGYLYKQVAEEIGTTEQTVKNYMRRLFNKCGADNAAHLVGMALRKGWIQ